jgi:secondary thiamine-phosphate synthase enzyme
VVESRPAPAPPRNGQRDDTTDTLPSLPLAAASGCVLETFYVHSERGPQFIDITDRISELLRRSGIQMGFAVVFSRHTTAAIRINEAEPQLLHDIEGMLERIAPVAAYYRHDDLSVRTVNVTDEEEDNGHAHCRHLLMGTSEAVPIVNGELYLGRWQRLFLVELDRPRRREVVVQLVGLQTALSVSQPSAFAHAP